MKVVQYLMDGHFRATRHADGCGVLARAEARAEETNRQDWRGGGYTALTVLSEQQYTRQPGVRAPKDHGCVAKVSGGPATR